MIEINGVCKSFGDVKSLSDVTTSISEGSIFGLIGSNGSGKSTLLRIMSGVFRPDSGSVRYDGADVWENIAVKEGIVYLSDEQYFTSGGTIAEMKQLFKTLYPTFSVSRYKQLLELFGLDERRRVSTFSKGMQKQASVLLGLSCKPKYLFCDETFDGLDPVMRQCVKRLIAEDTASNGTSVVIASHNLRELEDIADTVCMLHRGSMLFTRDLDDMKTGIFKVQFVLEEYVPDDKLGFEIISSSRVGKLITVVARGDETSIGEKINRFSPSFLEFIPLTLEEIFITEMEDRGYDYSNIIV